MTRDRIDRPDLPSTTGTEGAHTPAPTMTAAAHRRFGAPSTIETVTMPRPEPGDDQVLVAVQVASLNPYDWHFVRGLPYIARIQAGLRTPKRPVVGADLAGVVAAVGDGVTEFAVGDRVFGSAAGTCAEYAVAREARLVHIPEGIAAAEAAGVPMAGYTALQAVRDTAQVGSGDQVLVNGASGGVGLCAVQIAKAMGAEVTAVCSGANIDLVRSVGADHVIDYTEHDFLDTDRRFDAVIDTVMTRRLRDVAHIMTPKGRFALVGALEIGDWIGPLAMWVKPALASLGRSQTFKPTMAAASKEDLEVLASMLVAGSLRTVVDRTYPLEDTAEALSYVENGHARGKVLVTVGG